MLSFVVNTDLAAKGAIPQGMLDALPPAEAYEAAVFPSLDEQAANKEAIAAGWDTVVGANVQYGILPRPTPLGRST